jgi:hypothetical protein
LIASIPPNPTLAAPRYSQVEEFGKLPFLMYNLDSFGNHYLNADFNQYT